MEARLEVPGMSSRARSTIATPPQYCAAQPGRGAERAPSREAWPDANAGGDPAAKKRFVLDLPRRALCFRLPGLPRSGTLPGQSSS